MSSPVQQIHASPKKEVKAKGGRVRTIVLASIAIALLLVVGILPRVSRSSRAAETARAATEDLPVVSVVKAKTSGTTSELQLPGNTEPINVAHIYARASGYVRERRVDIGTRVKSGQVLAVIESPEVDQQLAQARATLEQARAAEAQAQSNLVQARAGVNQASANIVQARANEEIAATTNDRWTRLVGRGVLPKQAGDERRTTLAARAAETQAALAASKTADAIVVSRQADVTAAEAAIQAQAANVRRLEQQQEFERVIAPFNGVVSERKIERGDLVSADAGGDRNLFTVVQGNVLRIKVSVPQTYAIDLHPGQLAEVTVTERPGRRFEGKVARTAEALDASSRTLLTEVQVNNSSGDLLPGMYSQVKFSLTRVHATILVPANALLANSQGTRVVVVSEDGRAHFVPVQVGRDLGTDVEIVAGLKGTERLITNPADTLTEGQALRVQSDTPKEKKG
jgi:RND family efflux transporter MFP subunit